MGVAVCGHCVVGELGWGSFGMEELRFEGVAMCVCLDVWHLQCIGVKVCRSCGVGELHYRKVTTWGELWCVAVIVWWSCIDK